MAAPTILTQPLSQSVIVGGTLSLSVDASGANPPLHYRWQFQDSTTIGTDSSVYLDTNFQAAGYGRGNYRVFVGDPTDGTSTSSDATIKVYPNITSNPSSQIIAIGSPVEFDVTATGYGLTYQWRRNSTPISGATSASYTIASYPDASRGTYNVNVTSDGSTITSSDATLLTATTITVQPVTQAVVLGDSVTLSVTATGHGLTYQWQQNTAPIAGATSSSFTINPFDDSSRGTYKAVVYGDTTVTSSGAILTVQPSITSQPTNFQSIVYGSPASLSVTATGHVPTTYQWQYTGAPITGAISSTYTIPSFGEAYRGTYNVLVTSDSNTVTSSDATIYSMPAITTQPISQAISMGDTAGLSVVASGHVPTYQWKFNTGSIGGATSSSYLIGGFDDTNTGSYTVVVTADGSSVTSSPAILSLQSLVITNISPVVHPNDLFTIDGYSLGNLDGTVQCQIDGTWTSSSISSWTPEKIICQAPSTAGIYNVKVITEDTTSAISYQGLRVGSLKVSQSSGGANYITPNGRFATNFNWVLDAQTLRPIGFTQDYTTAA